MSVIIHVAQDAIRRNAKHGTCDPAIIVRNRRGSKRYSQLVLRLKDGTEIGRFMYQPHDPLPCGARLWLTVDTTVCEVLDLEEIENADKTTNR